jgi:hypothetical protein
MDRPTGTAEGQDSATSSSRSESPTTTAAEPNIEQIAQRAYEIYQARGGNDGQDVEDWLQAERELRRGPQDRD